MKKGLIALISVFLLSSCFYQMTLSYFPNYVYHRFYLKFMENRIGQENQFSILHTSDEDSRLVVKPNPDFAYGSAFYNLNNGALRITGELPDSIYWSVALYEPNTTNFYIKNDREFQSNQLDLIITRELLPGYQSEQILSQTKKGFVLLRLLKMKKSPNNELTTMAYLKTLNIEKIAK